MIGRAGKRILAFLLVGTIILSDSSVQTFAAESEIPLIGSSETEIESTTNSELEIKVNEEETDTDQSKESEGVETPGGENGGNQTENSENIETSESGADDGNQTEGSEEEETLNVEEEDTDQIKNPEETPEEDLEDGINDAILMLSENSFSSLEELKEYYETNKESIPFLKKALVFSENEIVADANGLILLSCVEGEDASFEGKKIKLKDLSGGDSDLTTPFQGYTFKGLGRTTPFKGTITAQNTDSVDMIINTPFFYALDVSKAKIEGINTINIQTKSLSMIVLAQSVEGAGGNWSTVAVKIEAFQLLDGQYLTEFYPGSCIGTIKGNADFTLGSIQYNSTANVNTQSENAGLVCNTLEDGANFVVNEVKVAEKYTNKKNEESSVNIIVTSENAAGGLAGFMGTGASFTVNNNTSKLGIDSKWTVTGKNSGGIIGEATDISLDLNVEVDNPSVISNVNEGAAGGLIGYYHLTSNEAFKSYDGEKTKMTNVVLNMKNDKSYCGGLFGVLELMNDFTISNNNSAIIESIAGIPKSDGAYDLASTTSYGGLVGKVYGTSNGSGLAALKLTGLSVKSTVNKDILYYGGLIGIIGKTDIVTDGTGVDKVYTNGIYVVITGQTSTECCNAEKIVTDNHYFGGAVGGMFYDSVLEIAEGGAQDDGFTVNAQNIKYGGGIVGATGRKSTLRLAGKTDLSAITFKNPEKGQKPDEPTNNRLVCGQIVGVQNASLIYATKSWEFIRPTSRQEIDDIGSYGSVIRLGNNIGEGAARLGEQDGLSETMIYQEGGTHRTKFGLAAPLTDGEIKISSADEFALLSIAEQTYGDFDIYPSVKNGHILSGNSVSTVKLVKDIDLSNTGISGLQRDHNFGSMAFEGTFDGQGYTLKLDIGQIYASRSDEAGSGQIHGHSQVGLFSQANATIENLTVNGNINIRERTVTGKDQTTAMAVGGCVALSKGGASTFDNVTTNLTINCSGNGTESYVGGLIGRKLKKDGSASSVDISSCIGNAVINDSTTAAAHFVGGLIGVHTGGGTINVDGTSDKPSKLTGTITKQGSAGITDAKYGGLVSVICDNPVDMHLSPLTIDGQQITNNATTSSGGLLGYEWNNCQVYFGKNESEGVEIISTNNEKKSKVDVKGDARVGGLVYRATGYWQVNQLVLNNVAIMNNGGDLGLLICYGRKNHDNVKKQKAQLLYLEETKKDAYQINPTGVEVTSTGEYFDEWVVYTAEDFESIINNGNSVISIATKATEDGGRVGIDPERNNSTGYQNKTKNNGQPWKKANPNARYYYDLDMIRREAQDSNNVKTGDGLVNTSGEMVLWSVWRYCKEVPDGNGGLASSNIQEYLMTGDIATAELKGAEEDQEIIDLTGYSYYPVSIDAESATVTNCKVIFANNIIEAAEGITGDKFDEMKRLTFGTSPEHTQHYLMHSGLILNYQNTSRSNLSVTLSVKNISLTGTVGKGPNETGSGAIICGTVNGSGESGSHFARVEMNGVTLDGLLVNSDMETEEYAPILINTVGSYGGIDAQNISTSSSYGNNQKVATSLIGRVGSETATNISLAFSNNIELNGKADESIFSRASLLECFQYSGASSSGYYHFKMDDKFTYGREITGTVENQDDNGVSEQLYYFDVEEKVKDNDNLNDNDETNFNTEDYLPYVYQTKVIDKNCTDTFHELEVNVRKPDLLAGCGTYDDPYIIEQAKQLQLIAQCIGGTTTAGWKVNMVIDKDHIDNGKGDNHTTFTYGNTGWTDGSTNCDQATMRNYLSNAYYKIKEGTKNLNLKGFIGLGTVDDPFRGVVDGSECSVIIDAADITSGFVNVSYGSVIQNLSITYMGVKQKLSNNLNKAELNSNTVANESYFGGIIGDVKGGDNLIQNVSVDYKDDFKVGIQHHLECVGGFFGIVEGGGVILRDMKKNPQGLNVNVNNGEGNLATSLTEKDLAYVSPLVGRVLDGFVFNETMVSDEEEMTTEVSAFESNVGSDKNYTIGNISSNTRITLTDGQVTISTPEQLLLFSAIINSGACGAGYPLAYSFSYKKEINGVNTTKESGKVRNADYSKIGKLNENGFRDAFDSARKDDATAPGDENLPYLVTNYVEKNESQNKFWTLCASTKSSTTPGTYLKLSITQDLDMSTYKNGYRGIGGRYNCTASCDVEKEENNKTSSGQFQRNTPSFVDNIYGNQITLKVNNQIAGYSDDNFVAIAAGGLINMLRKKPKADLTMQNLTVTGYVELHDFSDYPDSTNYMNAKDRGYATSVGGVIGRYFTESESSTDKKSYLELNNLKVEDMHLYSDGATGGIVGQTGVRNIYPFTGENNYQYASGVTYTNCSYVGLIATSCQSTGGIVGAACDNVPSYLYGTEREGVITNRIVSSSSAQTGADSSLSVYAGTVDATGLGGLIGNVGSNLEINNGSNAPLVIDTVKIQSDNKGGVCRTGGAIGFLHRGVTNAYNITIHNSELGNGNDNNLGGIVGCWYSKQQGGVMEDIVIDGCNLNAGSSVGGVVGYIDRQPKIIRNITVKNTAIVQKKNEDRGVALVVGEIVSNGGIYGENILLKGNTITCKNDKVKKGRIVGKSVDKPIKLLGVSLQYGKDNSGNAISADKLPSQDVGSFGYSSYGNNIVISYDAFLTDSESGADLAGEPSVSVPGIGTLNKITGDTADPDTIIGTDNKPGIVKKNNGEEYVYIGSGKNYQNVTDGNHLSKSIVSTYGTNQDKSTLESDFNVVQIDGNAECLRQYLNAATNGAFDTAVNNSTVTVQIDRYEWDQESSSFAKVSDPDNKMATLRYENGNFYATAQYDNQNNRFTLVSVKFETDTNTNSSTYFTRTYHIPVIVRRMLQVDFMATMVSGTVFYAKDMEKYNTHALASTGEDITGYLTFKYNSNLSGQEANYDWQSYMEGGANLLGYYKKTIDTGSKDLPEGTKITLIDCQQEQRRYYAEVPEDTTSELEIFNGNLTYKNSDAKLYQPVSLAELLKISYEKADDNSVKWVRLPNSKDATVVDQAGNYYRLYNQKTDSSTDVEKCWKLTVTEENPEENYYVVISVPNPENHMLRLMKSGGYIFGSMKWSGNSTGETAPPLEIHQVHRYKEGEKYVGVETGINSSSEISFNFLDNYEQKLNDKIGTNAVPVKESDAKVEMDLNMETEVKFTPGNYEPTDPLFQEFRVSLKKNVGAIATELYFPSDASATVDLYAYYKQGDTKIYFTLDKKGKLIPTPDEEQPAASYDWKAGKDGNMVLPFAVLKDGVYDYIDLSPIREAVRNNTISEGVDKGKAVFYLGVKARDGIKINTSSVTQNDLLPFRENDTSQDQTKLHFTSVLSFKEAGLSYSTLRGNIEGSKGYYLEEKREAILSLDYLNVDQLGINLLDNPTGEINTMLTLDFSKAEGFNSELSKFQTLNNANKVIFKFTLEKKRDEIDSTGKAYTAVDNIREYLDSINFTGGTEKDSFEIVLNKNDAGSYPYYNEAAGVFSIPLTFWVNMDKTEYANYRIRAVAEVWKDNTKQFDVNNAEKAVITYTYAKINVDGVWK